MRLCKCSHAHALCTFLCHGRGPGKCDYTRTCCNRIVKRVGDLRYCAVHWPQTLIER